MNNFDEEIAYYLEDIDSPLFDVLEELDSENTEILRTAYEHDFLDKEEVLQLLGKPKNEMENKLYELKGEMDKEFASAQEHEDWKDWWHKGGRSL